MYSNRNCFSTQHFKQFSLTAAYVKDRAWFQKTAMDAHGKLVHVCKYKHLVSKTRVVYQGWQIFWEWVAAELHILRKTAPPFLNEVAISEYRIQT